MTPARVLVIAGSDSSAGAGIQADLKTAMAFGCYAQTAITAVTAQSTRGVRAVHLVPPEIVAAQIEACLSDIGADPNYFPDGLPTCPVSGQPYRLDPTTDRLVGHTTSADHSP